MKTITTASLAAHGGRHFNKNIRIIWDAYRIVYLKHVMCLTFVQKTPVGHQPTDPYRGGTRTNPPRVKRENRKAQLQLPAFIFDISTVHDCNNDYFVFGLKI